MNEFFIDRLNVAHALIDEHQWDRAIEILWNIDVRIFDEKILKILKEHRDKIERDYTVRLNILNQTPGDALFVFRNNEELNRWHAQEYLKMYERQIREYGL